MEAILQSRGWASAGISHPGHQRHRNEDAWCALPEQGLWLVADGMGGHEDGQYASRTLVDVVSAGLRRTSLDDYVERAKDALFAVNRHLHARAATIGPGVTVGCTVAALLAQGDACACIWAGDSRLYLQRQNQLYQISRDHSLEQQWLDEGQPQEQVAQNHQRHMLTRAIGLGPALQLEVRTFRVQAGDLLLLCSDGLYRELEPREISELLGLGEPGAVVQAMQDQVLQRAARDNFTAVVIQVDG